MANLHIALMAFVTSCTKAATVAFTNPIADPAAVVVQGRHRCTVLSAGMVRVETKGILLGEAHLSLAKYKTNTPIAF